MAENAIELTDDMKAKASLYAKMARVMSDLNSLPKDGINPHFGYKFVEATAVSDAVRRGLAKHGIAFFANMTGYGEKEGVMTVSFEFTFADTETGATAVHQWFGEANSRLKSGARDDKAINKAATAAEKYFLLKTFVISTGDEPDADADAPAERRQRQSNPRVQANEHGGSTVISPLSTKKTRAELTRSFITESVTITPMNDGKGKRLEFTDGTITAYAYTRKHFTEAGFADAELPAAEPGFYKLAHKVEVIAEEAVTKDESGKYWKVVALNIVTDTKQEKAA